MIISPNICVLHRVRAQLHQQSLRQAIIATTKERVGFRIGRPLNTMFIVYSSTYATANMTERICKDADIDYKLPTCLTTSLVNIVGIAWKDVRYAELLKRSPTVFNPRAYPLFAMRDGITIASSFVYKHSAATWLMREYPQAMSQRTAEIIASFLVPMTAQLFSTPLHILALDFCSRPRDIALASRVHQIVVNYRTVCAGRLMRIVPAFGVGGILNDFLKRQQQD